MTTKERNDLKNLGSNAGLRTSTSNSNVQIGNGNHVKHIDNNRTLINGSTHYGASSAANALKKLK